MEITLRELEVCFSKLMSMARDRGVESLSAIDRDFYWQILLDDWLAVELEPEVAVGSLTDDIQGLRALLDREDGRSLVDLDRLAAMLRLLAQELSES